jgi:N-carbamoylputrescine amidase
VIDARRGGRGALPEDANPGRPFVFRKKFYFTPGDWGNEPSTRGRGASGLICWDSWYPEAARLSALAGPAILFYPTPSVAPPREGGDGGRQLDAWRTVQRGHAVANGVYVAAGNRVGREAPEGGGAGIEFWGSSFICDPQGQVLAEASADREEILFAEVDLARLEDIRRNWPFLRDRRIDAYGGITRRYLDDREGDAG